MKVKEAVKRIKFLEDKKAQADLEIEKCRKVIMNYLDENDLKTIDVSDSDATGTNTYKVVKTEKLSVEYDIEKLKEKLPEDIFNEIIYRHYLITDYPGLVKFLRGYKANARIFKTFVRADLFVNKEAIKQLYALGDITKDMLKGTFNAKLTKYLTIKKKKKEDDGD